MVNQNVIEIILRARDEASKAAKQAGDSLKNMGKNAAESFYESSKASDTLDKALTKASNTATKMSQKFNGISDTVRTQLEKARQKVKSFADEFNKAHPKIKNTAETIKNNISTAMEHVKSKAKEVAKDTALETLATKSSKAFDTLKTKTSNTLDSIKNGLSSLASHMPSIPFKGDTTNFDKSAAHVRKAMEEINQMNVDPFQHISNAGLMTLQGEIAETGRKADGLKQKLSNIGSGIGEKVTNLGSKFQGLNGAITGVMGAAGMSGFKSMAIDLTISREKSKALMTATLGSKQAMTEMYGVMKNQTKNSVTQLDMLINSMNGVKMSTQMSNQDLKASIPILDKIGAASLLMGDDAEHATFVMKEAFSGLNGDFTVLHEQFGITADKMKAAGWSGAADDVEGYRKALEKCIDGVGDLDGVMDSTSGKLEKIKKHFRTAGLDIGEKFVPYIDMAADAFLELDTNNGYLSQGLIWLEGGISAVSMALPMITPVVDGIRNAIDTFKDIKQTVKDVKDGFNSLKNKAGELKNKLSELEISEKFGKVKQAAIDSWNKLKDVVGKVKSAIDKLNISENIGKIKTTAIDSWNKFKDAVTKAKDAIMAFELRQKLATIATKAHNLVMRTWQAITKVATMIQAAFNLVMAMNPIYLVVIAIVALIAVLGYLYFNNEQVRNTLNALGSYIQGTLINAWNWLCGALTNTWDWLSQVGSYINDTLLTTWNNFVLALQNLWTWLNEVWVFLSTLFITAWDTLTQAVLNVWDAVVNFGLAIWNLPGQIYEALAGVLEYIWNWAIGIYNSFVTTASNAVWGFINWLIALPGLAWTWLWNTITNFINWGIQVKDQAVQAGRNAVNGFIEWIKTLPGKAWTWLLNTLAKILGFGDDGGQKMQNAGTKMVNGLMNWLKQLPGKVWDELMNIGQQILNGKGPLVDKIVDLGRRMLDGFLNALGIHSPGYMAQNAGSEMGHIVDAMMNNQQSLADAGASVGQSILEGYNTNDFSSMEVMPNISTPDVSEITVPDTSVAMSVNPELLASDNQMIIDSTSQMQQQVGLQLTQLGLNITQLGTTSTENMNTILTNNTQLTQSYNILQNNIQQSLSNILTNTKLQWNNIKTTTEQNLKSILNSTNNVTQQMIDAWKKMKDSIVEAAGDIRTQASQRFDTLWSNIKTFYHNIQHPGGAGPSQPRGIRHSRGAVNLNAISNMVKPSRSFMTKQQVTKLGLSPAELSYIKTKNNTYNTEDILTGLQRGGAGGWTATVKPNLDFIKDKSSKWKIAGPIILGRYPTQDRFKVGEFENGTPNIDFGTFVGIAEDVFSQIHYDFYMDSSKYGSWQAAARTGYMNCSDGTDFLLAIAEACGFHGTKVHGYWGNIGHFWAEINGKKMDTTGFTKGLGWSPAQSHAGPAPGAMDVNDENVPAIILILKNILEYLQGKKEDETNKAVVVHDGQVSLNVNCNFEGNVPEGVTAEDVANMLNNMITDRKVLQAITSSADFQELDRRYKNKLTGAMERFRPSI